MNILKIFSDTPLTDPARKLLIEGVAPHEALFPKKLTTSVLSKGDPDPQFAAADIAFGQPDVADILESKRLRWVHLSSAGFTRYDNAEFRAVASERGLSVTNSSSVFAGPCAEHVFSFMLAQSRNLPAALQSRDANGSVEWSELRNASVSLRNQRVLLLGFGAIARKLVELLRPFQMSVVALRRWPHDDESIRVITLEHLDEELRDADHVVNLLPDNAESTRFVSAQRFSQMKPGAVFYNIGRGTTVDQTALGNALRSGRLAAAWLDVTDPEPLPPDHPLLSFRNCFITPHVAGGHRNEAESLVRHFLDNFKRYLDGTSLRDRIM
jgi:phosphoglycerate dehydrogenase-like enzyme